MKGVCKICGEYQEESGKCESIGYILPPFKIGDKVFYRSADEDGGIASRENKVFLAPLKNCSAEGTVVAIRPPRGLSEGLLGRGAHSYGLRIEFLVSDAVGEETKWMSFSFPNLFDYKKNDAVEKEQIKKIGSVKTKKEFFDHLVKDNPGMKEKYRKEFKKQIFRIFFESAD